MQYISANKDDIINIYNFSKELIDKYEDIEHIQYDYVLKWIYQKIEKHIEEYTKVYQDNKHVGYYRFVKVDNKMEIDDLYVLDVYRNRGIGTKIIQKCLTSTDLPIFLYVFIKNDKAVKLYERLGFKIVEKIKDSRYIMEYRR